MSNELFTRVVVPVANEEDAEATAGALLPYIESESGTIIVVHVIEKAGGAPDKASVEQRQQQAMEIFDIVALRLADSAINFQTELLYGTNVAETILEAAHDVDATAIVFTPRGGSRWVKLLSGDVMTGLLVESDLPVVALPKQTAQKEVA